MLRNRPHPLKTYLTLSRPFTLILPFIGIIISSYIAYQTSDQLAYQEQIFFFFNTLLGAVSALLLNTASNTLNQITDIDIDKINKPNRPLIKGDISISHAIIFTVTCYLLAFILYAVAVDFRIVPIIIFFTGLFLTAAYSLPPLRFKKILWVANISIALPRGLLLLLAGWGISSIIYSMPDPWILGSILFLYLVGAISVKDFSDIEGDQKYGMVTLPIKYGIKRCIYIISPFFILPFLIFALLALYQLVYPSIVFFNGNVRALLLLAIILLLWNFYIVYRLVINDFTTGNFENHPVWRHMYGVTFIFYVGLGICYSL